MPIYRNPVDDAPQPDPTRKIVSDTVDVLAHVVDAVPSVAPTGFVPANIPPPDDNRAQVLAEEAHRILDGGTPRPDSRWQRRELVLLARQAYAAQQGDIQFRNAQARQQDFLVRDKLEKDWYFEDLRAQSEQGGTVDEFLTSYLVPVHRDEQRQCDYVELPTAFLELRRYQNLPGEGVFDVRPLLRLDRLKTLFVPERGNTNAMMQGLFAGGLQGQYSFHRVGTRVLLGYDPGMKRPGERWAELELLLVMRRRNTGELPPPALLAAAQDYDILQRLLKLALASTKPEDKINDNNATVA